jgi:hypothetical protein
MRRGRRHNVDERTMAWQENGGRSPSVSREQRGKKERERERERDEERKKSAAV